MKLAIISFTKAGSLLCKRLTKRFVELGYECSGYVQDRFFNQVYDAPGICPVKEPLSEWTRKHFEDAGGVIFIGAAGIAVRAIAPCLNDKMTDPAVVVMDDGGHHVISLLSGHVGGANELTYLAAEITGAIPVITTATDVNQKTAIDVWAGKRGLTLSSRLMAKQVAAALLEAEPVGFYSDYPLADLVPGGFTKGELCRQNVWITARLKPGKDHMIAMFLTEDAQILRLIPPVFFVGIGCRKGVSSKRIMEQLERVFLKENLDMRAIRQITSIDKKADEPGIVTIAGQLQVPFLTYPATVLEAVQGSRSSSAFVKEVMGTDNVCERSALAGAGAGGKLLVAKQAGDGVTIAVAAAPAYVIREQER